MKEQDTTEHRAALSSRRDDVLPLVRQAITAAHEQMGTAMKGLSRTAEEYLLSADWPGGEQELDQAVRKACVLSEGPELEVEDFDFTYRKARSIGKFIESRLHGFMRNIKKLETFNLYDMVIPEVEKSLIMMVMKETRGNQIKAAQLLGINRNTLRSKIEKLGIKPKEIGLKGSRHEARGKRR
jgi:DNA-binding NtrC family response regulator